MSNERDVKTDNTSMTIEEIRERWRGARGPWRVHSFTEVRDTDRLPVCDVAMDRGDGKDQRDLIASAPSDIQHLLVEIAFLRSLLKDHGISIPDRKVR